MYKIKTRHIFWLIFITVGLAISFIIFDSFKKFPEVRNPQEYNPEPIKLFKDSNFTSFRGERVVHLDLKGAPPSIAYFEKIFPLFRALGVTSVLIEYEDMFPYRDTAIRATNAYSRDDIKALKRLAKKNNLNIIPLVQTFGHLEFLLKMKKFSHLREQYNYPESICPSHNETFPILTGLLDEVIEAHPKIRYIHMGCDEVFHLGLCKKCKEKMSAHHWSSDELFLNHVTRLANYIRSKYPKIVPLIWDDQLRSISSNKLKKFNVGSLIEPMVWFYSPKISLPAEMWQKYAREFHSVWIASSFKGATGVDQITTNIDHHVKNHISWMFVIREYASLIHFKGVVITGWQRYDHFAVLCELLPVGVPSLAHVSLILDGSHSNRESSSPEIRNVIACGRNTSSSETCDFPGASIYTAVVKFSQLRNEIDKIFASHAVRGYLTSYNVDTKYFDRSQAEGVSSEVKKCLTSLKHIEDILKNTFKTVYDKYTVTEWIETYVQPYTFRLNHMSGVLQKLANVTEWGPRYGNSSQNKVIRII